MKRLFIILAVLALVAVFAVGYDDMPRGPVIVASKSYLANTASIAATTVYTPAVEGNYELILYASAASSSSCTTELDISWTDENNSHSQELMAIPSGFSYSHGQQQMRFAASQPVQFSTTYSGCSGTNVPYDVYVTVIKE